MNIVRKPVAFNLDDPDQKSLYDHAMKRTNFSAYIKRLIQRDMEGWNVQPSVSAPVTREELDASLVSEFI
ncbi:hypothetical protein H839_08444 [Parageobacillus genomosp. 1]|uniref:CopG family transcriptional regulator n=1 Tax=Parageobacillus genomosp. 1 TaxID=1295642 RepID=A0ABC9VGR6_9BACL|nr:hypothetical protein [Parageobacillus genomosp. 1]EZP77648.1 hypothetical protein H839_08444 [Parageobacillus genomosp. 1]